MAYADANNLYGAAMTEALPIRDFIIITEDEVELFDLATTAISMDYGYILDFDLKYIAYLHDSHSDYLLAAEKLRITR